MMAEQVGSWVYYLVIKAGGERMATDSVGPGGDGTRASTGQAGHGGSTLSTRSVAADAGSAAAAGNEAGTGWMNGAEAGHFAGRGFGQVLSPAGELVGQLPEELEPEDWRQLYRFMLLGRLFDQKAINLQRQGRMGTYPPLLGQEAAQAGSAYALRRDDWLFPSFREPLAVRIHGLPLRYNLLYWMGHEEGNRIPSGVNVFSMAVSIGDQIPHAVGAAIGLKLRRELGLDVGRGLELGRELGAGHELELGQEQGGRRERESEFGSPVVLVYFGDGATSEGDFHEALNFAGVYRAPVVFFCQNNQYAISMACSRQTASPTLAQKALAYGFPGELVDGNDVFAVYAAVRRALERARAGQGPTLIEAVTYRLGPHTTADDPRRYRSSEEERVWREERDPILRLRRFLEAQKLWSDADEEAAREEAQREVQREVAAAEEYARRVAPPKEPGEQAAEEARREAGRDIFDFVFARKPDYLVRQQEEHAGGRPGLSRQAEQPGSSRFLGHTGLPERPVPANSRSRLNGRLNGRAGDRPGPARERTLVEAINDALRLAMRRDPRVVILGQDVGRNGGVFRVTEGLWQEFGANRVLDTPLAESGIVGAALGMAAGAALRPVAEIQFEGFAYLAFDQIVTQLARIRNRSRGRFRAPVVLRIPHGGGVRAPEHHSEAPEALFAHMPGLQVVIPATPYDAKGLLLAALEQDDPVIFFEPKRVYRAVKQLVPDEWYTVPIGKARIVRAGTDVTVVSWGAALHTALAAAEQAAGAGWALPEVIDLRSLKPWDEETVLGSVRRTGRLVVVQEAWRTAGLGSEIISRAAQEVLYFLEAPPVLVAGWDIPVPLAAREEEQLPSVNRVLAALQQAMRG